MQGNDNWTLPNIRPGDDLIVYPDTAKTRAIYAKATIVKHRAVDVVIFDSTENGKGVALIRDCWHLDDPRIKGLSTEAVHAGGRGFFELAPIEVERRAAMKKILDIERSMQREFSGLNETVQEKLAAVERSQAEIVDRVAAAARRASKVPVHAS